MRSLAGSLADDVLDDAILIPPHPPILSTNIRKVRGPQKVQKLVTQIFLLVNEKGDVKIAKCFSKTRGELSTTCNPKVMSRCLSAPDATSTSLPQEKAAKTNMVSVVRIEVFSIMYS